MGGPIRSNSNPEAHPAECVFLGLIGLAFAAVAIYTVGMVLIA